MQELLTPADRVEATGPFPVDDIRQGVRTTRPWWPSSGRGSSLAWAPPTPGEAAVVFPPASGAKASDGPLQSCPGSTFSLSSPAKWSAFSSGSDGHAGAGGGIRTRTGADLKSAASAVGLHRHRAILDVGTWARALCPKTCVLTAIVLMENPSLQVVAACRIRDPAQGSRQPPAERGDLRLRRRSAYC